MSSSLSVWPLAKRGTFKNPKDKYRECKDIGSPVVYGIIKPGESVQPYDGDFNESVLYALTLGKLYSNESPFINKTIVCINKDFPDIDKIIASVVPERTRYRENCLQLFEYKGEACYVFQVKDLSMTASNIASELIDTLGELEIPNIKYGRVHRLHDVIIDTENYDKSWYYMDKAFEILSDNGIHIVNCTFEPKEKGCMRTFLGSLNSGYIDCFTINDYHHRYRLLNSLKVLTCNIFFNSDVGGHTPVSYFDRYRELTNILSDYYTRNLCLSEFIFLSYYKAVMGKGELYKTFIKSLIRKGHRENNDMKWFMQAMEHYVDNTLEPLPKSLYEEAECIDRANSY